MDNTTIHLTGKEPLIADIARAAFGSWRGTHYRLHITDAPIDVRSSWAGGSRSWFAFVRLADMQGSRTVPDQSAFNRPIEGADAVTLPAGVVCVEDAIFLGKLKTLTIHIRPQDVNPTMLPAATAINDDELIVIEYTCKCKPSYNGIRNYRLYDAMCDTDITPERWEVAKASLIAAGMLNKAGAITPKGRNARKPIPAERKLTKRAWVNTSREPYTRESLY